MYDDRTIASKGQEWTTYLHRSTTRTKCEGLLEPELIDVILSLSLLSILFRNLSVGTLVQYQVSGTTTFVCAHEVHCRRAVGVMNFRLKKYWKNM
jgi:hypothetical protein